MPGKRAPTSAVPSLRDPSPLPGARSRLESCFPALRPPHGSGLAAEPLSLPAAAAPARPALTSPAARRGCSRTWRGCSARSSSTGRRPGKPAPAGAPPPPTAPPSPPADSVSPRPRSTRRADRARPRSGRGRPRLKSPAAAAACAGARCL